MMPALTVRLIVNRIRPGYIRYIWFVPASVVLISCMVCLSISRHHSYEAAKKIDIMEPSSALVSLNRALSILPPYIFQYDLQRIHMLFGKACLELAQRSGKKVMLKKSFEHFLLAAHLNPNDIKAAKGLALTAGLLEPEGSHGAISLYRKIAQLRPNGITVHYMIADYLYKKGMKKELAATVEHIAMLVPGDILNGSITSMPFYSPDLGLYIQKGLEKALQNKACKRTAFFALAKTAEKNNDPAAAVDLYKKGMAVTPFRNRTYNFIHLGQLYLKTHAVEKAFGTFKTSLEHTNNPEKTIRQIYYLFKRQNALKSFDAFAAMIQNQAVNIKTLDICVAKARMQLGLNELARARLLQLVSENPMAEAYYLLAVIDKKENDWNSMELDIQKATLLSPGTCHYYKMFATALDRQGKHQQAAQQRAKAKQCLSIPKS